MDKEISKDILNLVLQYKKKGVSIEHMYQLFSNVLNI